MDLHYNLLVERYFYLYILMLFVYQKIENEYESDIKKKLDM